MFYYIILYCDILCFARLFKQICTSVSSSLLDGGQMARSFVLALCQKGLLEAAIGVEFHQSSVVFSCNYLKLIPSKKTKLFRDQGLSLVCLWHLGPSHDCIVWQRPNALKWHLSPVSAMIRFGGQHKNFLAGQSGEEPRKSTLHSYSILSTLSLSLSLSLSLYIYIHCIFSALE